MIKINKSLDWNKWWNSPISKFLNNRTITKKAILKLIKLYLKKNESFFDVGCGTGYYSKELLSYTRKVISLDFSDVALDKCHKICLKKNVIIKFDLLLNHKIPLAKQVHLAFSDGLLEHFNSKNQILILRKISNSVCKGGFVISVVPHRYHPYTLFRKLIMNDIYEESMTIKEIKALHATVFDNVKIYKQTFFPLFIDFRLVARFFPMHLIAISKKI